jgi:hypothetical protein
MLAFVVGGSLILYLSIRSILDTASIMVAAAGFVLVLLGALFVVFGAYGATRLLLRRRKDVVTLTYDDGTFASGARIASAFVLLAIAAVESLVWQRPGGAVLAMLFAAMAFSPSIVLRLFGSNELA